MPRIPLVAAVAMAAAFAVPSVAHGATLHQDGRTPHKLLLQDELGETNLVSVEGSHGVVIRDLNAPITLAGVPTCMPLDARAVSCSAVRRIELDLGDGPDNARIATPHEVEIEGGAGNDRYVAHATDGPSRVDFDGGIGTDVANYFFATTGVRVSVDLSAGDGRPGDDDRIRRNVETVFGSTFADVLAGGPDAEHLLVSTATIRSPAAPARTSCPAAPGTTASTPATASRTPSTAVAGRSTGPRSTSTPRPPSPDAPRSSPEQRFDRSDGRPATRRPPTRRATVARRSPSARAAYAGRAPPVREQLVEPWS